MLLYIIGTTASVTRLLQQFPFEEKILYYARKSLLGNNINKIFLTDP